MKFVVSNRRAGKFRDSEKAESRAAVAMAAGLSMPGSRLIADHEPADPLARRTLILEGTEADMRAMDAQTSEDVIVEPLIRHDRQTLPLGAFRHARIERLDSGFPTGTGVEAKIEVRGDGAGLPGATVYLVARPLVGEALVLEGQTDGVGEITFSLAPLYEPVFCVVLPYGDFWSTRAAIAPPC